MQKEINIAILFIIVLGLAVAGFLLFSGPANAPNEKVSPIAEVKNFEECAAAGNPIMESYPRQCKTDDGKTFTEQIAGKLSREEAINIAGASSLCSNVGVMVFKDVSYNENSRTWWIDLERMPELEKDGCNPCRARWSCAS